MEFSLPTAVDLYHMQRFCKTTRIMENVQTLDNLKKDKNYFKKTNNMNGKFLLYNRRA